MRLSLLLLVAFSVCGCAVMKKQELTEMRERKVSEPLLLKMKKNDPLFASDVAELTRRGVPNAQIEHYIRRTGVASPVREGDLATLRAAKVDARIINLLELESAKLEADRVALGIVGSGVATPTGPLLLDQSRGLRY
jgi:hypothetical protein